MAVSVIAKFIADEWFKIMAILCFLLLAASLTLDLKVDNGIVGLFALSGMIWGSARWLAAPSCPGWLRTHTNLARSSSVAGLAG